MEGNGWDRYRLANREYFEDYVRYGFPMGRLDAAEEAADVIVFIASPRAHWIKLQPMETGLSLAERQVEAIRLALLSKVLVITGGLGWARRPSSTRSCASWPPRASACCCVPRRADDFPASALITVAGLARPELLVEVQGVAVAT